MSSLNGLLSDYYQAGSNPYYKTLFLKEEKENIKLLYLLHNTISQVLYCSSDPEVILNKLQWWSDEVKKTLALQAPSHPITIAIANNNVILKDFDQFTSELMSIVQSNTLTNNTPINIWKWLVLFSEPDIQDKDLITVSEILFQYEQLNNIYFNFLHGYRLSKHLPKYLKQDHFKENSPVIRDTLLAEFKNIQYKLNQLSGTPFSRTLITQLKLINSIIKKGQFQPHSIYNRSEMLSPIHQLFISYISKFKVRL